MAELFRPGDRRLRAVASPVDTFVRPNVGPRPSDTNEFLELARGLREISPMLDRYFQEELAKQRQEAEADGATAYLTGEINGIETNREGWKALIDQERRNDQANGTNNAEMLASMNPHFKRGYIRSHLDSMGMTLEDQLLREWSSNPEITNSQGQTVNIQQTDDVAAVQAWVQQKTAEFIEANGLNQYDELLFAEAFVPRALAASEGMVNRHSAWRLEERQNEYGREYSNNIQMIVGGVLATGNTEAGLVTLQDRLDQAVRDGLNPRKANELLVSAIVQTARENGDMSILNLLDGIDTGHGPLGNVGWVREMKTNARQAIQQWQQSQYRFAVWQEEEARARALRATMGQGVRTLLADPSADITSFQQSLIDQGNWNYALSLGATQEQLLDRSNQIQPNHQAIVNIRAAISSARTEADRARIEEQIMTGVTSGQFDSQWATRLYDDLDQAERYNDALSDPYINGLQSDLERTINTLFANSDFPEDITRGSEAVSVFRQRLTGWIEEETNANGSSPSTTAIQRQAEEIASAIYNSPRYAPRDDMLGEGRGQMRTAQQLEATDQLPDTVTLPMLMGLPPERVNISPTTLPPQDVQQLYADHLKYGDRSLLTELGEKWGMPPADLMMQLMGVNEDPFAVPEEPVEPTGEVTPEQQAEAEQPVVIQAEMTPENLAVVSQIVGADWWDRNLDQVALGEQAGGLVDALQAANIAYERRNGGGFYVSDYTGALEAVSPMVQSWAEQAGVDPRLIAPGPIEITDSDPLYAALANTDLLSSRRISTTAGGVQRVFSLSEDSKTAAILYLLSNQGDNIE
jgi:hypothetical protein